MRAYNWIMLLVMINAGMALTVSMGIFGEPISDTGSGYSILLERFSTEGWALGNWEFPTFSISGIEALSLAIISASIVMAFVPKGGSGEKTVSGVATSAFVIIFFGSWSTTIIMFETLAPSIPQLGWFINLYSLINMLVFAYAIIQMHTGGAKSNV